ncbi:MAG: GTP 3',8-cyclase MoaA [Desulfobacteraceae bacterium]|nr:GTP 3',8-cyclase MoaA [Desulfobacteraceae bacterium]
MLKKPEKKELVDAYKRHINYLRISITDRCNLRCIYCSPGKRFKKMPHESILSYEEILRLTKVGMDLGITKVRVTGGEPFVRKGCCEFLEKLIGMKGLSDISLTTNGVLLKHHLARLHKIGILRLNISLDTLDPAKYKEITGINAFNRVWEAIISALEMGFSPVKINVVALRGINEDELKKLAELTFSMPVHVRFIEQMPFGGGSGRNGPSLAAPEIRRRIETIGPLLPVSRQKNDGPARRYRFEGAPGEIGLITAVSQHFCKECNRLRLTADGRIRTCLLSNKTTDIKTLLRSGTTDEELAEVFLAAVADKPRRHHICDGGPGDLSRMVSIGG